MALVLRDIFLRKTLRMRAFSPNRPHQAYRGDLVQARKTCLNQTERYRAPTLVARLKQRIADLTRQIRQIDADIEDHIAAEPDLAERARTLQDEPGVGAVTATTLIALLPELGALNRRAVASLAGLAPHAHDSGAFRGQHRIHGGRPGVRSALYMAALSAARHHPRLSASYQTLRKAGKPPKLALIAIARKLLTILNAKLRNQTHKHSC